MLKRVLPLIIPALIVIATSCNSSSQQETKASQRVGNPKDTVNYPRLYSDVFNQLITHHTYDKYLGCDGKKLQRDFFIEETIDSSTYATQKKKIMDELINDAAPKSVIYVDTTYEGTGFKRMARSYFSLPDSAARTLSKEFSVKDTTKMLRALKKVKEFSLDSLHSDLAEIRSYTNNKDGNFIACDVIGKVSLSHVYLNKDNDMGLLFWAFRCGPKCGKGKLIKIKHGEEGWKIIDTMLFYIN